MTDTSAFSSSGVDAIARTVDIDVQLVPPDLDVEDCYEIGRTSAAIASGGYHRVALQFPDELLPISVPIYRALKRRVGAEAELYVLADTSYGSCCVDEVAAQHVDADAVVHYGHACMSKTVRLPVIYVFGRRPLEVADCATKLAEAVKSGSNVFLKSAVEYSYKGEEIAARLREHLGDKVDVTYRPPLLSASPGSPNTTADTTTPFNEDRPYDTVLYIGPESLALTNLLLTSSPAEVHSYDPASRAVRLESAKTNKLLMRRYAVLQRARDADVFGILVGTLGVASYLPLIGHLRGVLARARKKSYTINVGKLNPAKLGNFMEIECFVVVACPENSVVESKEFPKPIVTPFELEIALKAEQSWTGRYVLDFDTLLAEHQANPPSEPPSAVDPDEDPDQPVFSLVTGKYRHAKRYGDESKAPGGTVSDSSVVALRNQETALTRLSDSAAGEYLQSRTFRGLERRMGEDAPSVLEQGRSGIARGYQDDR